MYNDISESMKKVAFWGKIVGYITIKSNTESVMFFFMKYLRLTGAFMLASILFIFISYLLLSTSSRTYLPFP